MTDTARKVLISGGTGFVGSAVVRALAEKYPNFIIAVIDQNPPRAEHVLPEITTWIQVDITSTETLSKAFEAVKPDIVIHTAGVVPDLAERFGRRLEQEVWKINFEGTRNILDISKHSGVEVFIYTSSCCVVIDDTRTAHPNINEEWPSAFRSTIYGESKAAAEALVLNASSSKMVTCALRPSVLCGPGDYQLLPAIHACIAKYETPFLIGDGFNLWDITHVDNAADAHILAIENLLSSRTAAGEAFFIQNNEPIAFRDFCLAIWAHFGHVPPFQMHIPKSLAYFTGLVCETVTWLTGTTTTLSRGSVQDACAIRYASGNKAKEILGYEARIGIEEAIRLSCEDYASRLGFELPPQ
ncbi:hypothetical protein DTO013E5_7312 [Penicillium roqueforti]|uniref:NAD(P)-binding domain n=1 Tax=Penicillium roqueforti (strain FM164) TaxID=1365484 RepID=W6QGX8_PENRF|nr:uncharacterized protein LCP9604111_3072 [Penicillium roqueforti]CDM33444.1 NAD(P)-binding domain [Penicillium roqueforti FM164]KAF9250868.1 hypothetical protein LCP9604111_3072 [Penicillium roqueforti]KAI1830934.1 hypothetical protein CBS147337_8291 [Penicillium roqueforti]KAI2681489.1 hypothetical protein CBS147355_2699 [Penicillium roqueforti]KAI2704064.1 hypothetical protein CBS147372_2533 [Penicillium roqueforti]